MLASLIDALDHKMHVCMCTGEGACTGATYVWLHMLYVWVHLMVRADVCMGTSV